MSSQSPERIFDELLIIQCKAGDKKALELLIKRWNPKIMSYATRNIKNHQGAQDVAQEVWLAAIRSIHRLKDESKIGSWLLGITHNKSMDWIKKNPSTSPPSEKIYSSIDRQDEDQRSAILNQALLKLSMDQRNVLSLFYTEGYSLLEISEILKISQGTVKSRLFYARESLKKAIKIYNYE